MDRDRIEVGARRLARYLAATEGDSIEALASGGVLSPTYPATWETALALELLALAGEGLPTRGMIHLASELVQIRPLRVDDAIRTRLEVERVEPATRGRTLTLRSRSWNAAGQLALEGNTTLLLRGSDEGRPRAGRGRPDAGEQLPDGWSELTRFRLGAGRGRRYALASGDFNPIHLWGVTARPLGFPAPILHGFCTQALVAHAIIRHRCGGRPNGLRRLTIDFRAPLLLPAAPRLLVSRPRDGEPFRYRLVNGDEERKVYAEGAFVASGG